MTMVKVTDTNGQVIEVDQDSLVYNDFTRSLINSDIPTEGYMVVGISAAGGLIRTALVPVAKWHEMTGTLQNQITALQAHDVVLDEHDAALAAHDTAIDAVVAGKQDKFAGTTAQYVRGNGSLSTFPTIPTMPDISGKSDKANFTALSVLAAHGQSAAATNSPTNSKTDYNIVTTLLGTLTDGLNQTNTAQNTIATNLNSLATKVNAIMTWLGLNKDAINSLRTAGAA